MQRHRAGCGYVGARKGARVAIGFASMMTAAALAPAQVQVKTEAGLVEGKSGSDPGIRAFLGIPYAAPPAGPRRWRPPQPAASWTGVRPATAFGARCMQGRIFEDMVFRDETSEDCLYLNVWTPATSASARLPVMAWIYGGGFQAGSASEPRQDGENLAKKGVVVVSMNYRLGVFGFLAHPELTRESEARASGNYGLLDQIAALEWVQKNVAAFGGDPGNVTVFGESAGSFSVSALMASPLARGLFHRAIGESGAFFGGPDRVLAPKALADSEAAGARFAAGLGADTLAALRGKPAQEVLEAALRGGRETWFSPNIDGHVLPAEAGSIFAAGGQSRVPLLAGWNEDESRAGVVLAREKVTARSFEEQARARFKDAADALLQVYPARSDAEALESAAALAGDMFIGYCTWKWLEAHLRTGQSPVYRYSFDRDRPVPADTKVNGFPATSKDIGARHAGEIEYVFGTLSWEEAAPWEPADFELSELMMAYWTSFARSGDPNLPGLPAWPRYEGSSGHPVMHLAPEAKAAPDLLRRRYELLDRLASAQRAASR